MRGADRYLAKDGRARSTARQTRTEHDIGPAHSPFWLPAQPLPAGIATGTSTSASTEPRTA